MITNTVPSWIQCSLLLTWPYYKLTVQQNQSTYSCSIAQLDGKTYRKRLTSRKNQGNKNIKVISDFVSPDSTVYMVMEEKKKNYRHITQTTKFYLRCEGLSGEGNGSLLQYFGLENPMDRGAWQAAVHRVTNTWTQLKQLSKCTCIHHFRASPVAYMVKNLPAMQETRFDPWVGEDPLEKAMATHYSIPA